MTKYEKKLIQLTKDLKDQMESERQDDFEAVPQLLASKIDYICGFISALQEEEK